MECEYSIGKILSSARPRMEEAFCFFGFPLSAGLYLSEQLLDCEGREDGAKLLNQLR